MNIFTTIGNWLRALRVPQWLKDVFSYIINKIVFPLFSKLGEEAMQDLERYIIDAGHHEEWSGIEKITYVKDRFAEEWKEKLNLTDSIINLAIELVLQEMKSKGFTK